jgi:CPA1 family monovalent cation:H+ antiporter
MYDIYHRVLGLFVAAVLVALVARRLRLPYTVGLVAAGCALSLFPGAGGKLLTHDLIFELMLPPLLFEAALFIHWHELKRDFAVVIAMAFAGVLVTAAIVAGGMMGLLGWPLGAAAIFGVLIAATDPVAVIALFKDIGVTGRLRFLVETESLLNDGVAAVLFGLILAWVEAGGTGHISVFGVADTFVISAGGGTLVGLACAGAGILLAWGTTDHLVETGLTLAVAYGSFYLAEDLHVSGVLATVAAGILMGNLGILREDSKTTISAEGRAAMLSFWEFAAFLANSIVFLLIGLAVAAIPLSRLGPFKLALIIVLVLAGRALTVYPIAAAFSRTKLAVPMAQQHVLWWGGLRGALGLALALALPADMPFHDEILIATFSTVVFSVVAQGLSMSPLLRALRLR